MDEDILRLIYEVCGAQEINIDLAELSSTEQNFIENNTLVQPSIVDQQPVNIKQPNITKNEKIANNTNFISATINKQGLHFEEMRKPRGVNKIEKIVVNNQEGTQPNLNRIQKMKLLEEYIKQYAHEAEQGSDQWLLDRQLIIGGSEISTISGCNPYSKLENLVAQKVGLSSFEGNVPTRWGNLFENVSELFFKTLFLTNIYSMGSIPHKRFKNHRYSPDGLCILQFDEARNKDNGLTAENYFADHVTTKVDRITLLEFKSPFASVPSKAIPKHYLPQVKAGLCTIDITEVGLFINNMFRKCSISQLDFSINYNNAYHRDKDIKLKDIDAAIANGMVLFYIPKDKIQLFLDKFTEMIAEKMAEYNSEISDDDSISSDDESNIESSSSSNKDYTVIKKSSVEKITPLGKQKIRTTGISRTIQHFINKDDIGMLGICDSDSDSDEICENIDEIYETNILYKINKNIVLLNTTSNTKVNTTANTKSNKIKNKIKSKNKENKEIRNPDIDESNINEFVNNMIDFGDINGSMFDEFLELYKPSNNAPSFIDIHCVKPQINKDISLGFKNLIIPQELEYIKEKKYLSNICKKYDFQKIINKFANRCIKNGDIPIGYLPWKLLRSSNILVDREPDYLDAIGTKIDEAICIVKDILQYDSLDARANKFGEYFPDSDITKKFFEEKMFNFDFIRSILG